MRARLALSIATLVMVSLAGAEVVEEETWYSAEGKVVKTVKRTLSGADASASPDWEPAWVIRERLRDQRVRVSYASPSRYERGYSSRSHSSYPYTIGYGYYYPRSFSYGRSGFGGYLRTGSGRTHWGVGLRRPGLSLWFTR